MTNEAVKVELTNSTGNVRRYTCADGTGIAKGSILKLTDPRTAIISSGTADMIAGIAAEEKVASDGATSIACWTDGIFDLIASGTITAGQPVMSAGIGSLNYVCRADNSAVASGAAILGYALEDGTDEEVINVRVKL